MNDENRSRIATAFMMVILAAMLSTSSAYAASKITRVGYYTVNNSKGHVTCAHFEVNGKTAFCIEHNKTAPKTGHSCTSSVYKNNDLRRILYYGYGGPEQWKGFSGKKEAIMCTGLLLSQEYSGKDKNNTYPGLTHFKAFKKYVSKQDYPKLDLKPSKSELTGYYSFEEGTFRTDAIMANGTGSGQLTLEIPDGYTLHNNRTDKDETGTIKLAAGDMFYIKTDEVDEATTTVTIQGHSKALQPIIYKTSGSSVQDLVQLSQVEDAAKTMLTIKWNTSEDLKIKKTDADTGAGIGKAEFKIVKLESDKTLYNGDDITAQAMRKEETQGTLIETSSDGSYEGTGALSVGSEYAICETEAPDGYKLSNKVEILKPDGKDSVIELTFQDEKQKACIKILKKGTDYQISNGKIITKEVLLEGVTFELAASEDIKKQGSDELAYSKGDVVETLVTDSSGEATSWELPPGKYIIRETKPQEGYAGLEEEKTIDLSMDSSQKDLTVNVSLVNERIPTKVTIIKMDNKSRKVLAGAVLEISDEAGNKLEVTTNSHGKAVLTNLPAGKYTVKETKAPKGYTINEGEYGFRIGYESDQSRECTVEILDQASGVIPETSGESGIDTGDGGNMLMYAGALLVCVIGAALLTILRRCGKF